MQLRSERPGRGVALARASMAPVATGAIVLGAGAMSAAADHGVTLADAAAAGAVVIALFVGAAKQATP